MRKTTINETEIWVCSRDEANAIVRENRGEAWRIWTEEEVTDHILASPEELQAIIDKKRAKPGPYLKRR